jgi:hypothetical protein
MLAQSWKYNPEQLFSSISLNVFFIVEAVCAPRVADCSQFSGGGLILGAHTKFRKATTSFLSACPRYSLEGFS